MTLIRNAYSTYHNHVPVRETVNTALHGVFGYAAARIGAAVVSQITGDHTLDLLAEMIDAYAPLIGAATAAQYAYSSPSNFTRIVVGPLSLGIAGLGLGASLSATPEIQVQAIDDVVNSLLIRSYLN